MWRVLLLMVMLWAWVGEGAVYFVSTTGNDTTGDGSAGNPWATGQKAKTVATTGDTVNVAVGYYNERITLTSAGNAGVTWIGTFSGTQPTTTNLGFQVGGVGNPINNVTIRGFAPVNTNTYTSFDEPNCSGIYYSGVGGVIESNWCCNEPLAGIFLESRTNSSGNVSSNITVRGNTCISNGLVGIYLTGAFLDAYWNVTGRSIQSNAFYKGSGLALDADGMYFLGWYINMRSNVVHGADFSDPRNSGAHCDGIQTWGIAAGNPMGRSTNCIIQQNFIETTNANGAGFFGEGHFGTVVINNEFLVHKGISSDTQWTNMTILNNIISDYTNDAQANPAHINLANGGTVTIENNILFNGPSTQITLSSVGALTAGWNDFYRDDGVALQTDASYTLHTGDLWGTNPILVGPYSAPINYNISSFSPMINAATAQAGVVTNDFVGVTRPQGSAWDIGAFELPSSVIPLARVTTLRAGTTKIGP